MNTIENLLLKTKAVKIANETSPFWYTSGKIGPYFINTHFLYGNDIQANKLLDKISKLSGQPLKLIQEIKNDIIKFYETDKNYKNTIDLFINKLNKSEKFTKSEYISGGERRDWFFSVITAHLSEKKHLYIFKDLSVYDETDVVSEKLDKNVYHIADLITQASSYERTWIPALQYVDCTITGTACIVDRNQGGSETLKKFNIDTESMVVIDKDFFNNLLKNKLITDRQYQMLTDFYDDPDKYGYDFILNNKDFVINSIKSDNKSTLSKAKRCIDENPYGFDDLFIEGLKNELS